MVRTLKQSKLFYQPPFSNLRDNYELVEVKQRFFTKDKSNKSQSNGFPIRIGFRGGGILREKGLKEQGFIFLLIV